jgi:hypothetical protein
MREALPDEQPEQSSSASDPALIASDREQLHELLDELRSLPESQRRALLLRQIGGLTYEELSVRLAVSVPAVEALLFRARKSLRDRVGAVQAALAGSGWLSGLQDAVAQLGSGGGASKLGLPLAAKAVAVVAGLGAIAGGAGVAVEHHRDRTPRSKQPVATVHRASPGVRLGAPVLDAAPASARTRRPAAPTRIDPEPVAPAPTAAQPAVPGPEPSPQPAPADPPPSAPAPEDAPAAAPPPTSGPGPSSDPGDRGSDSSGGGSTGSDDPSGGDDGSKSGTDTSGSDSGGSDSSGSGSGSSDSGSSGSDSSGSDSSGSGDSGSSGTSGDSGGSGDTGSGSGSGSSGSGSGSASGSGHGGGSSGSDDGSSSSAH